jgi:hypothetical protein
MPVRLGLVYVARPARLILLLSHLLLLLRLDPKCLGGGFKPIQAKFE